MIGDWVSYCGFYNKVIYIGQKVSMYNGKGTEFTTDPEYIRPIPLTEEILVKNGFKRHLLWHETDDGSKIYIPLACGGGIEYVSIYKHFEDLTVRDIDIEIPIHYVHQLQHLLRLCGIEKEIEL